MITWILGAIIDFVSAAILTLLNWLVLAVSANIGLNYDDTFESMKQAFPFAEVVYPGFVAAGLSICFGICIFQVFKALFGPLAEAESPVTLCCRTTCFIILVAFSSTICSVFVDLGSAPYQAITKGLNDYGGEKMEDAFSDPPSVDDFTDIFVADSGEDGDGETLGGMASGAFLFAEFPGLMGLILIIMLVMIIKKYFALLMEVVERYVILGFLTLIAPLCIATGASRATNFVFKGWIQMMISQVILMCFGLVFLGVANETIALWLTSWVGGGSDAEGVARNPIMMFLLLMSWLRIGQNVDAYMASLGLKAAQAGGGLGNDIMSGIREGMPIANAVSNKMLGTNYGQPGGFKSAAHELFGSAAKKNAVKASGHNLGMMSPGAMRNSIKAGKDENGNFKDRAGITSLGRKGNSLISPGALTANGNQKQAQKMVDAMMATGATVAAGAKSNMGDIGATALGLTGSGVKLDESKTSMNDGIMHVEGVDKNGNAFSADIAKTGTKGAENGMAIKDANGKETGFSMVGGEIHDQDLQKQMLGQNVDDAINSGLIKGDAVDSNSVDVPAGQNVQANSNTDNNVVDNDSVNYTGEDGQKLHMDDEGNLRDEDNNLYNGAVSMTDEDGNAVTASALNEDGTIGEQLKTDENGNFIVQDGKFQTEDGNAVDADNMVCQTPDVSVGANGLAEAGAQNYNGEVGFQANGQEVQAFKADDDGNIVTGEDGQPVALTAGADGVFRDADNNEVDANNVAFSADGGKTAVDKDSVQAMGNVGGEQVALGKGADGQFTVGGQALTAMQTTDFNGAVGFQDKQTGEALTPKALGEDGKPIAGAAGNVTANADGSFTDSNGKKLDSSQVGFVDGQGKTVSADNAQAVGAVTSLSTQNGQVATPVLMGKDGSVQGQLTANADGSFTDKKGNTISANDPRVGYSTDGGKTVNSNVSAGDVKSSTSMQALGQNANGQYTQQQAENVTKQGGQFVGVNSGNSYNAGQVQGMSSSAGKALYGENSNGEIVAAHKVGNQYVGSDGKALSNVQAYGGTNGAEKLSGYSIGKDGTAQELTRNSSGQWVDSQGKTVSNPVMAAAGMGAAGAAVYGQNSSGEIVKGQLDANGNVVGNDGKALSNASVYSGMGGAEKLSAYSVGSNGQVSELTKGADNQYRDSAGNVQKPSFVAAAGHDGAFAYGKTEGGGDTLTRVSGSNASGAVAENGKALSGVGLYSGNGVTGAATMNANTGSSVGVAMMGSGASVANNPSIQQTEGLQRFSTNGSGEAPVPVFANSERRVMTNENGEARQLTASGGKYVSDANVSMSAGDSRVGFMSNGKEVDGSQVRSNFSYSTKDGASLTPVAEQNGKMTAVTPNANGTFSGSDGTTFQASDVKFQNNSGGLYNNGMSASEAINNGNVNVTGGDKLTTSSGASASAVLVAPKGSYVSEDRSRVETAQTAQTTIDGQAFSSFKSGDSLKQGDNGYYVENAGNNTQTSSLQMFGVVDNHSVALSPSASGGYEYNDNGQIRAYNGYVSTTNMSGQHESRTSFMTDDRSNLAPDTIVRTNNDSMDSSYTTSFNSQGTHIMDTSGKMHEVAASSISTDGNIIANNNQIALADGGSIDVSSVTQSGGSIQGFSKASQSFGKTESGSGQTLTLGDARAVGGQGGELYYQIGDSSTYISASAFAKGDNVGGDNIQTYSAGTPLVAQGKDGAYHGVSADCMRYTSAGEPSATGNYMKDSNTGNLFEATGKVFESKQRTFETGATPEVSYIPSTTNPTHAKVGESEYVELASTQRYDGNHQPSETGAYYKTTDNAFVPVSEGFSKSYSVGGIESDANGRITIPAGASINENRDGTVSFHHGGTEYTIHPRPTYDASANKDAVSIGGGSIITQKNHQYEKACSWVEQHSDYEVNTPMSQSHAQSLAKAIGIDSSNVKSARVTNGNDGSGKAVVIVRNDNSVVAYNSKGTKMAGAQLSGQAGCYVGNVSLTSGKPKGTPCIDTSSVKGVGPSFNSFALYDKDIEASQENNENSKGGNRKKR